MRKLRLDRSTIEVQMRSGSVSVGTRLENTTRGVTVPLRSARTARAIAARIANAASASAPKLAEAQNRMWRARTYSAATGFLAFAAINFVTAASSSA